MTPKQLEANRKRCETALGNHFLEASRRRNWGPVLYGLLDAAFGKLSVSQADAGRKNALQWLRRQAAHQRGEMVVAALRRPAKRASR